LFLDVVIVLLLKAFLHKRGIGPALVHSKSLVLVLHFNQLANFAAYDGDKPILMERTLLSLVVVNGRQTGLGVSDGTAHHSL
jgi:hypothetical protein